MKPRIDLREPRLACFSRTFQDPPTPAQPRLIASTHPNLTTAFAVAVFGLLAVGSSAALAQQNWPTDDAYDGSQYPAQPGFAQPQYSQPQYPQPQYGQQQGYPQQGYPQQAYAGPDQGYAQPEYQPSQAFSPDRLEQMVAPIALYPDNLLSMALAASTYPAQVAAADQWRRMQGNAPPEQIAAAADAQSSWDPSIKSLTAFPQVLDEMASNLQWTTDLGNAYYNQPQDVMQTVQLMRERAQAAGTLQNTPQEQVTEDQGNIELAPPSPDLEYVPSYNPWQAYGQPVDPYPGFSVLGGIGSWVGNALLQFGPGIAMQAFNATPFGLLSWGIDWLSHSLLFGQGNYFTQSNSVRDWGFPHGGPRAFEGRGNWARNGDTQRFGDRSGWGRGGHPEPRPEIAGNRGFNGNRDFGNRAQQFNRYGDTRGGEGWNRGNFWGGNSYTHPAMPQQSLNHYPQPVGRPQQFDGRPQFNQGRPQPYGNRQQEFGRQGFGAGNGQDYRPSENYGQRNGMAFANPGYANPGYRAPESGYRGSFGQRSYGEMGGGAYAKPKSSGGGFHLFGHGQNNYGGGSYGGGSHGFGGGSFKAPKAPKAPHFGGGGHFGGGHSGGGHSGGGHSGGGHSGGGGHGHHH